VCPDYFHAWRAADRAAWAAEKAVLADSLRAIDEGKGDSPAPIEVNRAKLLRGAANDLFGVAMAQMEVQARALATARPARPSSPLALPLSRSVP
jgi:hypothetical protein